MAQNQSEGRYANAFSVGHNAFEIVLEFGQVYVDGRDAFVHSRIVTAPRYAKLLLETLHQSLCRYETTYGEIPDNGEIGEATRSPDSIPEHPGGRTTMPDYPEKPKPDAYKPPSAPPETPRYKAPTDRPGSWQRSPQPGPRQPPGHESRYPSDAPTPDYPEPKTPPATPPYGSRPETPHGYGPSQRPPDYAPPKPDPQPGHEHAPHEHPTRYGEGGPSQQYPPHGGQSGTPGGGYGEEPKHGTPPAPCHDEPKEPCDEHEEPECPKPSDQLDALKTALKKREDEITALTQQKNTFQTDITGLEQTVTEQTTILTAYQQARKSLDQKKRDLDDYVGAKTQMLDCAVKDEKPCIEKCIADIDEWIEQWDDYAAHLRWSADKATAETAAATQVAAEKQAAYDREKTSATDLDSKLTALKALRDLIEKKEDDNKFCDMYVLLKELREALAQVRIRTPKELEHDLCVAWTALSDAKAAARDAQAAADAASAAAATAKTKSDEVTAKRRDEILGCVTACCCPEKPPQDECCERRAG